MKGNQQAVVYSVGGGVGGLAQFIGIHEFVDQNTNIPHPIPSFTPPTWAKGLNEYSTLSSLGIGIPLLSYVLYKLAKEPLSDEYLALGAYSGILTASGITNALFDPLNKGYAVAFGKPKSVTYSQPSVTYSQSSAPTTKPKRTSKELSGNFQ
ncbi:hypothetical protein [Mycobacterium sp.]|uniref:hypothetical protein n=1 Tax=Mycobacterium sp. TaxID=1785 RepID=UPI0031CEB5CA